MFVGDAVLIIPLRGLIGDGGRMSQVLQVGPVLVVLGKPPVEVRRRGTP